MEEKLTEFIRLYMPLGIIAILFMVAFLFMLLYFYVEYSNYKQKIKEKEDRAKKLEKKLSEDLDMIAYMFGSFRELKKMNLIKEEQEKNDNN